MTEISPYTNDSFMNGNNGLTQYRISYTARNGPNLRPHDKGMSGVVTHAIFNKDGSITTLCGRGNYLGSHCDSCCKNNNCCTPHFFASDGKHCIRCRY